MSYLTTLHRALVWVWGLIAYTWVTPAIYAAVAVGCLAAGLHVAAILWTLAAIVVAVDRATT